MRAFIYILLIALCGVGGAVKAQQYNIEHYTVQDGLLHSFVNDIVQDASGNVWVATGGGLCKFDGTNFTNFTTRNGINSPRVYCIAEDVNQNIWIGSAHGINVYQSDSMYSLSHETTGLNVKTLAPSADGSMWMMSDEEVMNVRFQNGQFTTKTLKFDFGEGERVNILQDRSLNSFLKEAASGHLFIGINNSVYRYKDNALRQMAIPADLQVFTSTILEDDAVIFGTSKGLYGYENESLVPIDNALLNDIQILKMVRDGSYLWMLGKRAHGAESNRLLLSINLSDTTYYREIGEKNGLIKDPTSLFIDHEKNIWTGSNGGLSILRGESFLNYNHIAGLSGYKAWGIHEDRNGSIWVGTIGQGLSIIEKDRVRAFTTEDGLPDLYVGAIFQDRANRVLLGTGRQGLCQAEYDPSTDEYVFSKIEIPGLPETYRVDQIIENQAKLYVATTKGLYVSENGNDFEHLPLFEGDTSQVMIHKLLFAQDGVMYVCSKYHGLFTKRGNEFERSQDPILRESTISTIAQDTYGHVWVGTIDRGIARISGGEVVWIDEHSGLSSNVIYILQADVRGNLWVGSNLGLDRFNALQHSTDESIIIRHYSTDDGLQALEMNLNGSIQDRNGDLWFATNNGVVKYNHKYDLSNQVPPITSILKLKVHSEEVSDWSPYTESINSDLSLPVNPIFPFDQNHLTFEFVGISYKNPKAIQYSWMLEGFDKGWGQPSSSRQIIYSSLPAGDYVFKLKAANNDGIWNETPVTFPFTIKPPFWATWWFRLLAFVAVIALIWNVFKLRTRALKNRQRELEGTVKARTQEIVKQMDIVEGKNREIIDSINYAKRLQNAILPPMQGIQEHLQDSFILFKPKDVVSGDFYWFANLDNISFIAAADCTGHGVPGAMVSVVCSNALNRTVKEFGLTEPAKILDKTRELVIETFAQSDEDVKDGMDIALCAVDLKTNTLQYAGANNALYLLRNDELIQTKGDKQHIGKHVAANAFTNHTIQLQKGDRFYLFTDGFADQFGGPKGKKFMYKPFRELLKKHSKTAMNKQGSILDSVFETWRGDVEQVDDVCVIGVEV